MKTDVHRKDLRQTSLEVKFGIVKFAGFGGAVASDTILKVPAMMWEIRYDPRLAQIQDFCFAFMHANEHKDVPVAAFVH